MGQLLEYLKISLKSIRDNKMRSLLTMLGIIIGIGSVIMIVSVGNGVKNSVSGQLNNAFSGQTYIMAGNLLGEVSPEAFFDRGDVDSAKEKIDHIASLSMEVAGYGTSLSKKGEFVTYYNAVTPDYIIANPKPFVSGRYFTEEEYDSEKKVCVLSQNSAKNLFGHTDVVGQTFTFEIEGQSCDLEVVGVKGKSDSELYEMVYVEDDVEFDMPFSTYCAITGREDTVFEQILFKPDSAEEAEGVIKKIISFLEARKKLIGQKKISYISFTSYMESIMKVINYITIFISFVAAISLMVGGIGVMNIMLVSVTERTREIGIRKSLGARTSSIMLQFLAEAGVLTSIGGLLGILFGYLGGELICLIMSKLIGISVVAMITPQVVIAVTFFSAAIGIFFGIYPAKKAAKLNPIEALRQE